MDNTYNYRVFMCSISYDQPQGGNIQIAAKDADEARAMLTAQYGHMKHFVIHNVIPADEIKPVQIDPYSGMPGTWDEPQPETPVEVVEEITETKKVIN